MLGVWRIASAVNIDVDALGGMRGLELVVILFPSRIWAICIFVFVMGEPKVKLEMCGWCLHSILMIVDTSDITLLYMI